LYQEKLQVVMQYSEQMMFLQLCVSAIFTVVFLRNPILGVVVALILVMWKKIVHPILCHLVCFSSFLILAKACESSVQIAQLSESIHLEDRLQNILRMPFVMLPMFTLIGEYVYGFLNLYLCIGIVGILFLYAIGIRKWMFHLIRQASERLEKVHIPD
jgi:hypothetical protein